MIENDDKFILAAACLLPVSAAPVSRGAVLVDSGRIKEVGSRRDITRSHPDAPLREFPDSILLPGLVNAHIHLEYSALGPMTQRADFLKWIMELIKRYRELSDDTIDSAVDSAIEELIASGITCVGEVSRGGASLRALKQSGLKGVFYTELAGVDDGRLKGAIPDFKARFNDADKILRDSSLRCGVFPHSVYTLCQDALEYISAFARERNIPCGLHAAEVVSENEFVSASRGALADFLKRLALETAPPKGSWPNTIEYLRDMKLLTPMTQLVHCVHLDERSFALIEGIGANIILCPRSNHLLKNDGLPISALLKYDINTGIGTDSLASNYSFDMFQELRFLKKSARSMSGGGKLPANIDARLIEMATIGGARAMGMRNGAGTLAPGGCADMIAVRVDNLRAKEAFSPVYHLISEAKATDVHFTMIDGVVKYDYRG